MRKHTLLTSLLLVALVAGCITTGRSATPNQIDVPPTNDVSSLAISPDGLTLAVVSRYEGRNHLWLQELPGGEPRPLAGTEEAVFPFWSPDGSQLGYFSHDELRRIDLKTGKITRIIDGVGWPAGATWGRDNTILFATHGRYLLWRISANGGAPTALTTPGLDQFALVHPHFLPDGMHFLFYVQGTPEQRGVYLGRTDAPQTRRLVESEAAAVFAGGKVFFLQDGTLHARTLDFDAMSLRPDDQVIDAPVPLGSRSVAALAANGGRVIYRTGLAGAARQLTWYSRAGRNLGTVGAPFYAGAGAPALSPDGKQAVINYMLDGIGEIGIVDLATGTLTNVTNNPANDSYPIWAADGSEVLFSSKRTSTYEMYRQAPGGRPLKVFGSMGLRHPMDMTRDSRLLVYRMNTPDMWLRDMTTGQETVLIPPGTTLPQWPQLSPDGRWIAFQSAASGRRQIHLYGPLLSPDKPAEMSTPLTANGGGWVRWSGDGRELYYAEPDGTLMAMGLAFTADGGSYTIADPVRLFAAPMSSGPEDKGLAQQYMVTNDGQRFLVIAAPEARSPVHVLQATP